MRVDPARLLFLLILGLILWRQILVFKFYEFCWEPLDFLLLVPKKINEYF